MDNEDLGKLLDDCVKTSIKISRKYMSCEYSYKKPTTEEWQLAIILFKKRLK